MESKILSNYFLQVCSKVASQTDRNDHTGARLTTAQYFKLQRYVIFFEFVKKVQDFDGSLLADVNAIRTAKSKEMMLLLKEQLSAGDYSMLSQSF